MKNVLILVQSSMVPGYDKLFEVNKETWGTGFDVWYYFGRINQENEVERVYNCLYFKFREDQYTEKNLAAFKWIYENILFDYIFFCCSGSYIDKIEMQKFIADKPLNKFYCGIASFSDGADFASGSGFFLSRDLVKMVIDNANEILTYKMGKTFNDVEIGRFLTTHGISIDPRALRSEGPITPGCYHYHLFTKIQEHYNTHNKVRALHEKDNLI
jgi:hypothetical protein